MQATLPPFPAPFDLGSVRLRALTHDDTADWFAVLTDPNVIAQTSYDIRSHDAVERMITHYCTAYQDQRFYRWAIAANADDRCLGTCGFYSWDATHKVALLGYELARSAWGQGIMTRAVHTVLDWAYTTTAINRIQATVMVGHHASARVLEKQGFQHEGTLREYLICRGQPRDFWMFGLLPRDYHGSKGLP
jgi:ribosomal-protein-alanine N-acetyltransferase